MPSTAAAEPAASYTAPLTAAQVYSLAGLHRRLNQAHGPGTGRLLHQDLIGALYEFVELTGEPPESAGSAYCDALDRGEVPDWAMDTGPAAIPAGTGVQFTGIRPLGDWPGLVPGASPACAVPLTAAQILGFRALTARLGTQAPQDGGLRLRPDLHAALEWFAALLPCPSAAGTAAYAAAVRAGQLPDWSTDPRPLTETTAEWAARVRARRETAPDGEPRKRTAR